MDDTEENQHENQHGGFLPLSPPIQDDKPPQESHYQSSSAPVGRPPPSPPIIIQDLVDFFDELESGTNSVLQEDCVVDQDQQFQDFSVDDSLPEMDPSYSDYALFAPVNEIHF